MAVAAITTALSTFHISKSYSLTRNHLTCRPSFTYSLSSRSSEFITTSGLSLTDKKLVVSWIEDASSVRLFHVMADASAVRSPTQKKVRSNKVLTSEPRYSKAARRFYNENFRESSSQRLSKVLAAAGVASRRSCEELIFDGRVTVNGSVCNTPQTKVDPKTDMIYVNGNRLPKKLPPKVYLALNKPKGYICSSGENQNKSVISLFNDYMKSWDKRNPGQPKPRLFTVGRLDVATTGLIIVTNDGEFAQKISHPSSGLSKEYIATIDGSVHKRHLLAISEGTVIDGVHCTPDAVELLPQQPDKSRARVRIVDLL
ncbi:putative ribosomal large subunit pseudouridine synthase SVR1, chloroplastic isoform X2 [Cynara cardunculus var. scolymus]|uniref:putative ribosomal large subunit pseudouridine synthase SVR1, chloroplastic isoform X2 n=1 Tax=Cynara cardunculus var. scolymus TaxID=59895 RepID=UPI000D62816F|nr:putative ribosomal large subunit pseudouridine synthase SVR1, chloroplastic isoform X2 [Cynara cardunculus var. scolymus]